MYEREERENLEDIYREITAVDSAQRRIYNTRSTSMPDIFFHLFSLLARILFLRSWSENSSWALTRTLALSSPLSPSSPPFRRSKNLGIDTQGSEFPQAIGCVIRLPLRMTTQFDITLVNKPRVGDIPYTLHTSRIPRSRATAQTCGSALAPR